MNIEADIYDTCARVKKAWDSRANNIKAIRVECFNTSEAESVKMVMKSVFPEVEFFTTRLFDDTKFRNTK